MFTQTEIAALGRVGLDWVKQKVQRKHRLTDLIFRGSTSTHVYADKKYNRAWGWVGVGLG
jgi:hypothetical protein